MERYGKSLSPYTARMCTFCDNCVIRLPKRCVVPYNMDNPNNDKQTNQAGSHQSVVCFYMVVEVIVIDKIK